MARSKVKLEFIENEAARRVTYKKRVKGVIKKTQEISVLCGVDACCIIYGPYDNGPVVWPSFEPETKRIISNFKQKLDNDHSQRSFDQLSFLKESLSKAEDKLMRLKRRNRELEMENVVSDLLNGKPIDQVHHWDFGDICWVIEDRLRSIQHRIRVVNGESNNNHLNNGEATVKKEGLDDVMEHTTPSHKQDGPSSPY